MEITIRYSTIDGQRKTIHYKNSGKCRKAIGDRLGKGYEVCVQHQYAISGDGIMKAEVVSGIDIDDLLRPGWFFDGERVARRKREILTEDEKLDLEMEFERATGM